MYLKNIIIENNWPIARLELFEKDLLKYPEDEVLIKKILMSKINRRVMEFFYDYLSRKTQ